MPPPMGEMAAVRLTERATLVLRPVIILRRPLSHGCAVPALPEGEPRKPKRRERAVLPLPMGEVAAVRLTERVTLVLRPVIIQRHPLSHGCAVPALPEGEPRKLTTAGASRLASPGGRAKKSKTAVALPFKHQKSSRNHPGAFKLFRTYYFSFLRRGRTATTAAPLISTRALQRAMLLSSPVRGLAEACAVVRILKVVFSSSSPSSVMAVRV